MKILVTGAGGKTGQAVIRALVAQNVEVRGLVFRPNQTNPLLSETIVGDMTNPAILKEAVAGVDKVYHICPNMHEGEVEIGRNLLAAISEHPIQQLVYHSVLHPQTELMPHHWNKLRVEEAIFESGVPFTIVQPTAYMQNLLAYWPEMVAQGTLTVPYPPETEISLVDLNDVADVVATVLTDPTHMGATYELVGTHPLSQFEVAEILSARFGRKITVKHQPLAEWQANAKPHLAPYALNTLSAMFDYYANYGLVGNPTVLGALLKRAPRTLAQFAQAQSLTADR